MGLLYISKGIYPVTADDILDTINGGSASGDLIISQNISWKSGTTFLGTLDHANTGNRVYTFPNASGTVPLLSMSQTWTGLNTYNAGTFKVNNILFTTTGPQIIGGTTLQLFNSSSNFIKSTIGNLDMITMGGSSTQRNINLNVDATNDVTPVISMQSQGVNWITFDPGNTQFIPINNILHLGNSSHKWVDVWATNGTIQTSFSEFKKNIVGVEDVFCMDLVKQLDTIRFQWKEGQDDVKFGFNADALKEQLPEAVAGPGGIYQSSVIGLLLGAVRHLETRLSKLENNH